VVEEKERVCGVCVKIRAGDGAYVCVSERVCV